jgi:hypothetical protein
MNALTPGPRLRRGTRAAAVVIMSAVALSACASTTPTPIAGPSSTRTPSTAVGAPDTKKTVELVLNVVNNSDYDLDWVGNVNVKNQKPDSAPNAVLAAHGGTDRIVFHSNLAIEITAQWRVAGTKFYVGPLIGVPLVGVNGIDCSQGTITLNSPAGPTACDVGKGWAPDAHVTFINVSPK